MRLARAFSLFLATLLLIAPARAEVTDLSEALPGKLPMGALVDMRRFLETFPELANQGFLSEQLDELVARGVPDPRQELDYLALGSRVGKPSGVTEGLALGSGSQPVVPVIRELAAEHGADLVDSAYRGVTFVTGTYNQRTSRFADPVEDVILLGYDQKRRYLASNMCVDTLQGRSPSFRDEYGHGLDPETFLTGQMRLSSADRNAVKDTRLDTFQHLKSGQIDIWGNSSRVRMELRARATSSIKAMFALSALKSKLQDLAAESTDPAVRRLLLEQTTLNRRGAVLMVDTDSPRGDFVAGILALEELLRN